MTQPTSRGLRDAFGSFTTGVTVVTTRQDDGTPVGFTANSFSSVSLDPALLLVCPGKFLSSYGVFANCEHFAVNILSEGQENVSNIFASFKGDRFAQVTHHNDLHGVPLISGATAQFSCTTHQTVDAGDHCVLIGKVAAFHHAQTPGLGYVSGQYFSLGKERAALEHASKVSVLGAIIEDGDTVLLEKTPQGFRPPQYTHTDLGGLLDGLRDQLAAKCIDLILGHAYSVFQDSTIGTHHSYFLAKGRLNQSTPGLIAVPISQISALHYTSPAIANMMQRFAHEAGSGSFGLYLGDAEKGAVHAPNRRT